PTSRSAWPGARPESPDRARGVLEYSRPAMAARRYILALDQGTTGSTALVIDADGVVRAHGYAELTQYYPQPGWVEHDPEAIWSTVSTAARHALARAR